MLLHELSGFPVHQFAFGAIGAALGFGGFRGDFFKGLVRRENSFSASQRGGVHLRCWRSTVGILERPFQNPVNNEVRITPNGRSEVGVLVKAESKMAERLGGVAGLLEGTQHEVGDDALFRLADDLFNQALIVLRRDTQVAGRERHLHAALEAVAAGVRAAGFRRRRNAAMANGDFALVQIFDAERVTEGAGQLFKLKNFPSVGLLMNAMERFDTAAKKIRGDSAIGGEDELFNEAVSDVALAAGDVGHALLVVELYDRFGEIEVDGAALVAAGVEEQSEFLHVAKTGRERGVTLGHLGVAVENFVDVGVGHALGGTNDTRSHARGFHVAGGVEFHQRAHDQAIFTGLERAHAVRKSFRKHRDSAVGEVNGSAAETRFLVERRGGSNVVPDVGDVNLQVPAAVGAMLDIDGVVKIARGFSIDGDDRQVAEIFAASTLRFADGLRAALGFVKNLGREDMRQMMLADDDFRVDAEFARTAENFDDAACRRCASVRITEKLHVDDSAVELWHGGIRHDEAVAIMVENEAACDFVMTRERLRVARGVLGSFLDRRAAFGLAAREAVSPSRQFLDGAALFELGKHFEQGAIVGLFQMEAPGNVSGGDGDASNLQKTQYVIGTQL